MIEPEMWLAAAFSLLAFVAAVGFLLFRQPVHAALSFAVTVLSGSGLYLLLAAPYAAAATVVVYAGATIIVFLFALMFASTPKMQASGQKSANPLAALVGATSLTAILLHAACSYPGTTKVGLAPPPEATAMAVDAAMTPAPSVAELGREMYTRYLWAIELAGAILLVATLGAIHIARDEAAHDPQPKSSAP